MKPSQTPETTAVLPILRATDIAVASTSLRVFFALTTSSSRMMFAGLKKCRPSTSPGRRVNAAILFTSRVEVLVARMAPRFMTASSLLEHVLLDVQVFEHRLDHEVGVLRARRSPASGVISAPRFVRVLGFHLCPWPPAPS